MSGMSPVTYLTRKNSNIFGFSLVYPYLCIQNMAENRQVIYRLWHIPTIIRDRLLRLIVL